MKDQCYCCVQRHFSDQRDGIELGRCKVAGHRGLEIKHLFNLRLRFASVRLASDKRDVYLISEFSSLARLLRGVRWPASRGTGEDPVFTHSRKVFDSNQLPVFPLAPICNRLPNDWRILNHRF
jgi:hypothetical protein